MSIQCIIVMLVKQIGKMNVTNVRMLNTTQRCHRTGDNLPSNKTIIHRYRKLVYDQHKVQATYIWIDATGENIRHKDRILDEIPNLLADIPKWSYAENLPHQTFGGNSVENILHPRAIYRNPFKPGKHDVILMCDTFKPDGSPTDTNHRHAMQITLDKTMEHKPVFGFEQEYTLLDRYGHPFGWSKNEFIDGMYYCGVGCNRVYARDLVESHALACLYAGVNFGGTNAEKILSQWKYNISPSSGMKAADDLWASRYILIRIAEEFGICITLYPKSIKGNWNETFVHTHYSTAERVKCEHEKHIKENDTEENSSLIKTLSCGVGVVEPGKEFLENRQLPSNIDPYVICNALLRSTLSNE